MADNVIVFKVPLFNQLIGAIRAGSVEEITRIYFEMYPAEKPSVENACQECGRDNPTWFADNEVWNSVITDRVGVLCPNCFIARAEAVDFKCTGWKLVPENWGSAETGGEKADREMAYRMECFGCHLMLGYANPSGRGDSVKAFLFLCEKCADGAWPLSFEEPNFPRSSQNQTVSGGVEGAHEGTTADEKGADGDYSCAVCGFGMSEPCEHWKRLQLGQDSREPEKLNNAQNVGSLLQRAHTLLTEYLDDKKMTGTFSKRVTEWLAESSLSSPPPKCACTEKMMCAFHELRGDPAIAEVFKKEDA